MSYCFLVAGSEDREHLLRRCVKCMKANPLYKNADVYLYWQGDVNAIPEMDFFSGVVVSSSLRGVFLPRYELFKRFATMYDYAILIDDDLFMYPDTSYKNAISFLNTIDNNGICNIGRQFNKRKSVIKMIDYAKDEYNVCGGLVFPRKCVSVLIDFFDGTDENVTEDVFWLLLYVKGFDLYRDFSSNALHNCHNKSKTGDISGYYKMRLEKPHVPLLPQYTTAKIVKDVFSGGMRYKIPETFDVNAYGMAERKRCRKIMGLE